MSCGVERDDICRAQMDPTSSSRFGSSRAGDVQNTFTINIQISQMKKAPTLDGFCQAVPRVSFA